MTDVINPIVLRYDCPECDIVWFDTWDCEVDSECPRCHTDYTPTYAWDGIYFNVPQEAAQ